MVNLTGRGERERERERREREEREKERGTGKTLGRLNPGRPAWSYRIFEGSCFLHSP